MRSSLVTPIRPGCPTAAENLGKNAWKRRFNGCLSIRLFGGRVVVDDFSIEASATDRRSSRQISDARLSTLVQRAHPAQPEITISSVEMTDWQMLAEKWED